MRLLVPQNIHINKFCAFHVTFNDFLWLIHSGYLLGTKPIEMGIYGPMVGLHSFRFAFSEELKYL